MKIAAWGYVALTIDRYGPRGIKNTCRGGMPADSLFDAYRALDGLDRIDPERDIRVVLIEAADRILPGLPERISERAQRLLDQIGAALEKYYGAALLCRTTRAISLTDEGRLLVQGARRLLAEADELEALIRLGVEKISGPIRLSAPIDLGRSYLVPILDAFLAEHPEVTIDLSLTDGYVDLVGQGQDLAIRYGELADSTLRVKRLGNNRRVVCASPEYLRDKGLPQHPDDLAHHECILMRFGQTIDREWPFQIDGETRRVVVRGQRIANDGGLVRDWCRDGYGIARKSIWDIEADLKAGTLVELLREFSAGSTGLQIVYPATQDQPKRVRLLIEKIAEAFSSSGP